MDDEDSQTDFIGADFHYGESLEPSVARKKHNSNGRRTLHAEAWRNRRPICPYGCGEEGQLVEVVMKDGKAIGFYEDSEKLMFTADLQMSPKPSGRKIIIGPDGEPTITGSDET